MQGVGPDCLSVGKLSSLIRRRGERGTTLCCVTVLKFFGGKGLTREGGMRIMKQNKPIA